MTNSFFFFNKVVFRFHFILLLCLALSYCGKRYTGVKSTLLNISTFAVKQICTVGPQTPRIFPSCKSETLCPLNTNHSPFSPRSDWSLVLLARILGTYPQAKPLSTHVGGRRMIIITPAHSLMQLHDDGWISTQSKSSPHVLPTPTTLPSSLGSTSALLGQQTVSDWSWLPSTSLLLC